MLFKHGIDQAALVHQFNDITAEQGERVRRAVQKATVKALQSRGMTLSHIRQVLRTVATIASNGASSSALPAPEVEALLSQVFAGMDSAMEQAVRASQRALQQLVKQGADLRETRLKKALADLEKMEDTLLASVRQVVEAQGLWTPVLARLQVGGTGTGALATAMLAELLADVHESLREGRAVGLKASNALVDRYATLASGVLMGMSDALQQGAAPAGVGVAETSTPVAALPHARLPGADRVRRMLVPAS